MSGERDALIVDDEPVVLAAAEKVLRDAGMSIDAVDGVEAALERLRSSRYRVVLSDLKLPGAGGFELIRACSLEPAGPPVIMITGYATLDSAIRSFKLGAFDFLPKPFDAAELLGVVRRALGCASPATRSDPGGEPDPLPGGLPAEVYALGEHSWAALEPAGSAQVGLGRTFLCAEVFVRELELPALNDEILQGNRCARITTVDECVFSVWAPLSGRVIDVGRHRQPDDEELSISQIASSWLLRIVPANAEEELENLTLGRL